LARLLSRDGRFFDLFTEVASLNLEVAKHLRERDVMPR
jgi:hypothetical protein